MCNRCITPATDMTPYWNLRSGPGWECMQCGSVTRAAVMRDVLNSDHFAMMLLKDPSCIGGVDAGITESVERIASGRRPINVVGGGTV